MDACNAVKLRFIDPVRPVYDDKTYNQVTNG